MLRSPFGQQSLALGQKLLDFHRRTNFLVRFILPDGKGGLDRIKTLPERIISIWYTKKTLKYRLVSIHVVPGLAEEAGMVNILHISRHSGMSFFAVLNEPSESCW